MTYRPSRDSVFDEWDMDEDGSDDLAALFDALEGGEPKPVGTMTRTRVLLRAFWVH